jgi:hypothetical protein
MLIVIHPTYWYMEAIMFTPARDFRLETPWRVIMTKKGVY